MTPQTPAEEVFVTLQRMAREAPVTVCVRGSCMAPRFADGEHVLAAAARVYWPGDVVVFRAADGRLLLHRLLGYRPWRGRLALVTRGDACAGHDSPVPLSAVLGRVAAARPRLGQRVAGLLGFLGLALRSLSRG